MKKQIGKIAFGMMSVLLLAVVMTGIFYVPVGAEPGQAIAENKIPLGRDKATAPYAVFQAWMAGDTTRKCFDDSTDTVKSGATYANCAIRMDQDAVTKVWWLTVPPALETGTWLVIIRDGADGAEVNTDTDVATVTIAWNAAAQTLSTVALDALALY